MSLTGGRRAGRGGRAAHERQARQAGSGEFRRNFSPGFAGEIGDDGADVTDFALGIDEPGLFLPGGP